MLTTYLISHRTCISHGHPCDLPSPPLDLCLQLRPLVMVAVLQLPRLRGSLVTELLKHNKLV